MRFTRRQAQTLMTQTPAPQSIGPWQLRSHMMPMQLGPCATGTHALGEAMKLATAVNQYLDQTSPWSEVKRDKAEAAKTIYTALRAIDSLKVLFAPFLPFTSEKLHYFLGYDTPLFGEQYIEEVTDSLGTHNVLRYRDVGRTDTVRAANTGGTPVRDGRTGWGAEGQRTSVSQSKRQ